MIKIVEESKEKNSSSISEESVQSEKISQIDKKERSPHINQKERTTRDDQENKKYKEKIVSQLEALTRGDISIFTIYKPKN